jgi:hypothetical protein
MNTLPEPETGELYSRGKGTPDASKVCLSSCGLFGKVTEIKVEVRV